MPLTGFVQCGMLTFNNDVLHEKLRKDLGTSDGDSIDFLTFSELDKSVKDDVEFLRSSSLIIKEAKLVGWIYQYGVCHLI